MKANLLFFFFLPTSSISLHPFGSPNSFDAMRKFDLVAMNRSLLSVISNKNTSTATTTVGQSTIQFQT